MSDQSQGLLRSAGASARAHRFSSAAATCCVALSFVAFSPAAASALVGPEPPEPAGGWTDPGQFDTPTPFAMVDTDQVAAAPGIVQGLIYYDSGQSPSGDITFYSVAPSGQYAGQVVSSTGTIAGESTPGETAITHPDDVSQVDGQLFIPQGGWFGFSENAPIVGYTDGGGGDHVLFDTNLDSPDAALYGGAAYVADHQNNLDFEYAIEDYHPATRMYIQQWASNQYDIWFATDQLTPGNEPQQVPDDTEAQNIILADSDPNVVLTDCDGNPVASPVAYGGFYTGFYKVCVTGGSGGSETLTASDADSDSGVAPSSITVQEPAPAAGASPSTASVGAATVTGTSLQFPVRCQTGARCTATVRLTTLTVSKTTAAQGTVTSTSLTAIGSATGRVQGHRQTTLRVRLNAVGHRALTAARKLRVVATIVLTVNKHASRSSQVVTLRGGTAP